VSHAIASENTVIVRIPAPLRPYTGGVDEIHVVNAVNVEHALATLCARYKGLSSRILAETGELRQFIDIYLGRQNIRRLRGLRTQLSDGDVVSIIPVVAGA
jgi:molybdopterin synthase sulfur carrier subunit